MHIHTDIYIYTYIRIYIYNVPQNIPYDAHSKMTRKNVCLA